MPSVLRVALVAPLVVAAVAVIPVSAQAPTDDRPPPGYGARLAPLEELPPVATDLRRRGRDLPEFIAVQRDEVTPVRWDPCRSIRFVVNMKNAPENSLVEILRAFKIATDTTGYRFEFKGTTNENPETYEDRRYLPQYYGDRWSPVIVTWEQGMSREDGTVVYGTAAPQSVIREDGSRAWVTGHIRLNAEVFDAWINLETKTRKKEQAVILHEIGHILGIGHLDNPYSLMFADLQGRYDNFTPTDLAALRTLASGECMTDI